MLKKIFPLMLLLISVIILAACAPGKAAPGIGGTNWKLVSNGPIDNQTPAAEGVDTSLKFGADGQVSGYLGCNSFGGEYTQKDDQITFGALVSALMACQEPQMSQEGASFAILNGNVDYTIEDDTLTIMDASGKKALILTRQ